MKSKVVFENGLEHELTADELKLIRLALEGFNWCDLICDEVREAEYRVAMKNLIALFVHHLD